VWRRYAEFVELLRALDAEMRTTGYRLSSSDSGLPRLPGKRFALGSLFAARNFSPDFLDRRQRLLGRWLAGLAGVLGESAGLSPSLRRFLTRGADRTPTALLLGEAAAAATGVEGSDGRPTGAESATGPGAVTARRRLEALAQGAGLRAWLKPWREGSAPRRVVLYMGIVDVLQDYNARKMGEAAYKSRLHGSGARVSCVSSPAYCTRFLDYMACVFSFDGSLPAP
jgi:hypothetical protein